MPLLHKKQFVRKKPSENWKPTDKVFYCEITQEAFSDYNEFWERQVLLNSLVWSCELTGRPNLTYSEALECEAKARKTLSSISDALKKPFLFISKYTKRGRLLDVTEDIFSYIRDRYFVGESVEAIVSKHWYDCKVTRVIMPTEQEILEHKESLEDSDDEEIDQPSNGPNGLVNGHKGDSDDDDDIIVVRDDHTPTKETPAPKQPVTIQPDEDFPPFAAVKYEVIEIEPWDYKEKKRHVVKWDQIRRPKSDFTRDKCKIFVKQCLTVGLGGYWILKDNVVKSNVIRDLSYSDIFVGRPPKFEATPLKKFPLKLSSPDGKKQKKVNSNNKSNNNNDTNKITKVNGEKNSVQTLLEKKDDNKKKEMDKKPKPVLTEKEKEVAMKLEMERKLKEQLEFKLRLEKLRLERKWKKEMKREEARLMKNYLTEWNQKIEDLELEQHQKIPSPTPFECRVPNERFGDFLMILDFVNVFAITLELHDVYPNGITYDMLENALMVKEVAGVFNDIVQLLLGAIFSLQQEEDEEIEADTTVDMPSMKFTKELKSTSQLTAVKVANQASTWSQQYQGVPLQKAPLDALTLTEILRLHILASGATNVANAFWRHMNRGGYKHTDDPGMQFKLDEPELVMKLSVTNVFDLTVNEKIKLLSILVCQILTFASVRDTIEEKIEKLREVTNNFRMYKWAATRKEKEEILAKKQKLKDEKLQSEQQKTHSGEEAKPETIGIELNEEDEEEESKEKETRASMKKKETAEPQEKDFIGQIDSLTKDMRQVSMGEDRAFHRYWLFNYIPGLFVEDCASEIGVCYDETTLIQNVCHPSENEELMALIKDQALKNLKIINKQKEREKNSSDKENENNDTPPKNNLNSFAENNLLKTPNTIIKQTEEKKKNTIDLLDSSTNEEEYIVDYVSLPPKPFINTNYEISEAFGLCSASPENCPVHSSHQRPIWSYYSTVEQIDALIKSLNDRGLRECELKNNLLLNRDKIVESLNKFESFEFDCSNKEETTGDLKKALKRNLNFPPDTPVDRIMELTLRDMILETEEKIDNGMLGRIKVPDRDVWRQSIVDGNSFSVIIPQDLDWGGRKRVKDTFGIEMTMDDSANMEFVFKDGVEVGTVKELAIAILQVGQGLEQKYLKAPLAESDKLSRRRVKMENRFRSKEPKKQKKEAEEDNNSSSDEDAELYTVPNKVNNILRTPFERWEKSLIACSNFSQLFLHLSTLDNSITWSRSAAISRRCRICRRSSDYESMLLCDGCDGGFHMFCLKPKLTKIPDGDWFCDNCKPKPKPKTPKKQRRVYKEDSDEEENENDDDDEVEEEEEEDEQDSEIVNQEYCGACDMGGELVCCDTCPKSFHLDCADLRKIPRGHWSCPLCKEEKENPKKRASSSQRSRKKLKTDAEIEATLKKSPSKTKLEKGDDDAPETSSRRSKSKRSTDYAEVDEESDLPRGDEIHEKTVSNMIHILMSHNDSKPFRKPVFKQELPDYYVKVKKPMDLRTIKVRNNKNKYTTDAEFIADVLLLFQNTFQFYDEDSIEYKCARKLSNYFTNKVRNSDLQTVGLIEDHYEPPKKKKKK